MFEDFEDESSNPESLPVEQAGETILGHRPIGHAPESPVTIRNCGALQRDEALEFIESVTEALGYFPPAVDEAAGFARIAALEELKSSASATQSVEAKAAEEAVISRHEAEGKYQANPNRGTGAEVALARGESQCFGPQFLAYSRSMLEHMPHTFAALRRGKIKENRSMVIVRETCELDPMVQEIIDRELAGRPGSLKGVGTRELTARVKRLTLAFDNTVEMNKSSEALRKRFISVRVVPGGFMRISGSLPMEQGVAFNEALAAAAAKKRPQEDRRTNMQVKVDTLVERVTGQSPANGTPLLVNLVMTDRTLMQGDSEPAYLSGYGTIPAGYARYLVTGDSNLSPKGSKAQVWIRRLFTAPSSGELVAMESSKRILPKQLKRMIAVRDQFCRTPYCDAPIRHYDHVQQVAMGGRTSAVNGDGRCAWCNYTKETEGWRERVVSGPRHTIEITTPSGQVFLSTAPPLPGTPESPALPPPLDSC
ncbi:HNH endonuclease [Paeniglutamicibacter kerguelensis]|uniref:DUF222 domain-containing protein n=1 Tax=Paeniglutamicibacter kerguelensis TaxID=254788 RepID=A0ABS4XDJ6_9MICC|nr:DUF222 domain-containing protein [Paeniglutamicibacter kerguelensis]MBP2386478.1 hypothetical protein [Paeniglutamicibacter kerguelensis]